MIPKVIYFIWFGKEKPDYSINSFNNFKNVNCTYSIEYIYERDPFNSSNKDIKICLDLINTKGTFYYKFYNRSFAKKHQFSSNGIFTRLSACLRFYLLYTYGGIYLDCDTFPIKPFDEELLNNKGFCCTVEYNGLLYNDIYFMGSCENTNIFDINNLVYHAPKDQNVEKNIYKLPILKVNELLNTKRYKQLFDKFIKCELRYGETLMNNNYYIDHYFKNEWVAK